MSVNDNKTIQVQFFAPKAQKVCLGDINVFGLASGYVLIRDNSGLWTGTFSLPVTSTYTYYVLSVEGIWTKTPGQYETGYLYQNNILYAEVLASLSDDALAGSFNSSMYPMPPVVTKVVMRIGINASLSGYVNAFIKYNYNMSQEMADTVNVITSGVGVNFNLLQASPADVVDINLAIPGPSSSNLNLQNWAISVDQLATLRQYPNAPYIFIAYIDASTYFPFYLNALSTSYQRSFETVHFVPGAQQWTPGVAAATVPFELNGGGDSKIDTPNVITVGVNHINLIDSCCYAYAPYTTIIVRLTTPSPSLFSNGCSSCARPSTISASTSTI